MQGIFTSSFRFNRTILECKVGLAVFSGGIATGDLIEPYWNVKNDFIVSFDKKLKDLIEPYWNVKGTRMPQFGDFSNGFNRTILECKGLFSSWLNGPVLGFNRTILECKARRPYTRYFL